MFAHLTSTLILVWFPEAPATTRASRVILRADEAALAPPIVLFSAPRLEQPSEGIAILTHRPRAEEISMSFPGAAVHRVSLEDASPLKDLLARFAPVVGRRLLRHLLETVLTQFRENGPELASTSAQVLDWITPVRPRVECSILMPSRRLFLGTHLADILPPRRAYRIQPDGIQRQAGPLFSQGANHHWMLDPVASVGTDWNTRLVGLDGAAVWQVTLSDLRARQADILLRYLKGLDAARGAGLLQALDRWRCGTNGINNDDRELVEDCILLLGGATLDPGGKPLKPLDCRIDHLVPLPAGGALVRGWLFDPYLRVNRIEFTDSGGVQHTPPKLWPIWHADAAKKWEASSFPVPEFPGFIAYLEAGVEGPWRADLNLISEIKIPLRVPASEPDFARARNVVLKSFPASAKIDGAIKSALGPGIERLHHAHMERYPRQSRIQSRVLIGQPPETPEISIIVPVYRNLNFLGFQISALARSLAIKPVELIYILDSPEQAGRLEGLLWGEHLIHGIPMTLACHVTNLGFAAAVNSGARIARADTLVFLNSDVIPESLDWLTAMVEGLKKPGIGVVGPRLLYLDGSLQFAGMYFERDPEGIWYNRHFAKGYPASHAPANIPREVPAVTGACMMMKRRTFFQNDGFDENFVLGDFEDSDLCIRLAQAGYKCWYEPSAVLYHVERQSVDKHDAHQNSAATMVNRWRQHRLWAREIEAIMSQGAKHWDFPPGVGQTIERLE
ncbi:glycosyltransferase family 2 protein [Alphaproteobacteria bacterium]|nr:glycosyltransferase family 2 protein [Alphaproteobacteria bacterium]